MTKGRGKKKKKGKRVSVKGLNKPQIRPGRVSSDKIRVRVPRGDDKRRNMGRLSEMKHNNRKTVSN